ncbi:MULTISPECIES: phage tail protein [unclassified Gilliamella]|uniref:phage tail protein n=1 Tax=unclassified Gilliamella TaxID=2685620 RepID=UPI00226A07B3|nr:MULTISPECIES: phage tail protein [unclassified Gilliamella]MCX8642955.1 phage tail protein [Gilliamella sp. B3835]MCX8708273.1 phage tail protein [Gilliamella sp. B3783]MCX8709436.1 phage tail protein [Gilliamella sp. B3780]MCX8711948.1 phage tail protein [Gilliamella sp. B3468]MCX8714214.1 phage tail protein [Gilliamella sp. B3781]
MGFALPNGARVYVQKSKDAKLDFNLITNDKEAVVTLKAGHGLNVDDEVVIASSWNKLNNVVARIVRVNNTDVTLGNINTSNVNVFPANEGFGSLTKITDWERLPQIKEVASEGGEQQFVQIQFLEDETERQLPTIKSAKTKTFTIAHDSSLPIYPLLQSLDQTNEVVAMKMYVPKANETRYDAVRVSFDPTPETTINEVETVKISTTVESPAITFYKDK